MTATEARIHFGEVLRLVTERQERVVVERSGRPSAVILSVEEYERLATGQPVANWRALLDAAHERVRETTGGKMVPIAEEVIQKMREDRNDQLLGLP